MMLQPIGRTSQRDGDMVGDTWHDVVGDTWHDVIGDTWHENLILSSVQVALC